CGVLPNGVLSISMPNGIMVIGVERGPAEWTNITRSGRNFVPNEPLGPPTEPGVSGGLKCDLYANIP
ncbi:conserved hypothetical protein, partial [Trichinella spiralis]|uniref:hypothetical protein n=1 Tax=Trichinella spiralis TaxID=6334 RepID=UPI0001EFDF0A